MTTSDLAPVLDVLSRIREAARFTPEARPTVLLGDLEFGLVERYWTMLDEAKAVAVAWNQRSDRDGEMMVPPVPPRGVLYVGYIDGSGHQATRIVKVQRVEAPSYLALEGQHGDLREL
jgi:hypothetical protein